MCSLENNLFQNGATWLRADFHLHTKADGEFSYTGEENRIGLKGSPTWVLKIFTPPPKPKGKIFEGEGQPAVDQLVDSLKGLLH